jgi:hypothetical protein
VVGVDIEPVAFVHGRRRFGGDPGADVLYADLLDAAQVLAAPAVRETLDLARPVCLVLVSVGHFIPDTGRLLAALDIYRSAVPSGSLLAVTHASRKSSSPRVEQVRRIYNNTTAPMIGRDEAETAAFFGDWVLREPGVQSFGSWCSMPGRQCESTTAESAFLVGMAEKS